MRQLAVALFAVLQAGCTISTSTSLKLNPPNDAEAIVVFIRNAGGCRYGNAFIPCAYELWLDGRRIANIADTEYVKFSVPKGSHDFTINWPPFSTYRNGSRVVLSGTIELRGGETHYFLLLWDIKGSPGPMAGGMHLKELPAAEGERELKELSSK